VKNLNDGQGSGGFRRNKKDTAAENHPGGPFAKTHCRGQPAAEQNKKTAEINLIDSKTKYKSKRIDS
jgi:hypothetical protein